MKKILLIVLIISMLLGTTACEGRMEQMADLEEYASEQESIMLEKVKDCVNNENQQELTELFSKNVRKQVGSLDNDAKHFIDLFHGKKISKIEPIDGLSPAFEGSDTAPPMEISNTYILTLDDGSQYTMYINFCTIDEETPANIGIELIFLWTCTLDETPENYEWDVEGKVVEDEDEAGIFIYEHE